MWNWNYETAAWLCWALPIIGALLTPLLAKIGRKVRDYGAVIFSGAAMVCALYLLNMFFDPHVEWPIDSQVSWIKAPGLPVLSELKAGILLDPLSVILANVVAFISFLIMVYSIDYMHGEEGLTRYWFFMNFFIGNMLLLVLSDNLIQMLFGWEGVGLCSYALIGFWYRDSEKDYLKCWVGEREVGEAYPPSHCGLKAFMFTRFGDLFMLFGILILLVSAGTVNFLELMDAVRLVPTWILLLASLLLLWGPIGKSAQLPLMEWLPDAMAGPTTVSALIHAATMVKAGVYLVARMFPIIYIAAWSGGTPNQLVWFFYAVAWIGAITAFVSATQGMVSSEFKKVLAYSTVSQIGYMMLGLGAAGLTAEFVLGYVGGVFHLVSHALFKAALFLIAGAVIHAVGSRFFYHMGGLKPHMRATYWFMVLASCSLMGVPFLFSGFWSKDMVIEATLVAHEPLLFVLAIVTVALTTIYTVRMIALAFLGERKVEKEVHEATPVMLVPYGILASLTVGLGVLGFWLEKKLEHAFHEYMVGLGLAGEAAGAPFWATIVTGVSSVAMLLVGFLIAYRIYVKRSPPPEELTKGGVEALRNFLFKRWYINRAYYAAFVRAPLAAFYGAYKWVEKKGIDAFNYVLARAAYSFSGAFRKTHTGYLNYNMLALLAGILFVGLLLVWVIGL